MKINKKNKPRLFNVGFDKTFVIKDFGKIYLNAHEQLTFVNGKQEYDFSKTDWGYYSTPSINGRLKYNDFRVYLVKNVYGKIYLLTVQNSKISSFKNYYTNEHIKIILRLDNFTNEEKLIEILKKNLKDNKFCSKFSCKINKKNITEVFSYKKPPSGEPNYGIKNYKRKVVKCIKCNHFFAEHNLIDLKTFYKKDYSTASHGKDIYKKFIKINKLGNKSDNFHRVQRFLLFFKDFKSKKISLLDIGSGLSVFLSKLKNNVSWDLIGVEPNINFAKFGKEKLKLNILHSNFKKSTFKKKKFKIISLNKVAEHVPDPKKLLRLIQSKLLNNGYLYIEVPDGLTASAEKNGASREEFMVDHLHIFSLNSFYNLLNSCGFKILKIDKLVEKSGKFTLYAFCQKTSK